MQNDLHPLRQSVAQELSGIRTPANCLPRLLILLLLVSPALHMMTMRTGLATEAPASGAEAKPIGGGDSWPVFRGGPSCRGVAATDLPETLELLWEFKVPNGAFEGTAAIVDGVVYVGDLDGALFALDLNSGEKKWEKKTEW